MQQCLGLAASHRACTASLKILALVVCARGNRSGRAQASACVGPSSLRERRCLTARKRPHKLCGARSPCAYICHFVLAAFGCECTRAQRRATTLGWHSRVALQRGVVPFGQRLSAVTTITYAGAFPIGSQQGDCENSATKSCIRSWRSRTACKRRTRLCASRSRPPSPCSSSCTLKTPRSERSSVKIFRCECARASCVSEHASLMWALT